MQCKVEQELFSCLQMKRMLVKSHVLKLKAAFSFVLVAFGVLLSGMTAPGYVC